MTVWLRALDPITPHDDRVENENLGPDRIIVLWYQEVNT